VGGFGSKLKVWWGEVQRTRKVALDLLPENRRVRKTESFQQDSLDLGRGC